MKRPSQVPSKYDQCVQKVNTFLESSGIPCEINVGWHFKECVPHIPALVEDLRQAGHNAHRERNMKCDRYDCWHTETTNTIVVINPSSSTLGATTTKKTCYY